MTNRKDMIDEALIRPGRLEVQMEISLPDEPGRVQILNIHTSQIKENEKLASDVDIAELAEKTKNFSGAELAGLVRAAASTAMNRHIKVSVNATVLCSLKILCQAAIYFTFCHWQAQYLRLQQCRCYTDLIIITTTLTILVIII